MVTRRWSIICLTTTLALLVVVGGWALLNGKPVQASPGVLYVAPSGNCGSVSPCYSTVQTAVDAAQASDEIRVSAGTYTGINNQGGLAQVVYIDKSLTIRGGFTTSDWNTPDPETNITEWLAAGQGRVAAIIGDVDVTLEGLRMSYGNAAGLGGGIYDADAGGGLYISQADVNLDYITVLTSTVPDGNGGGLFLADGSLYIENSLLQGNYAKYGGGASFHDSAVTFIRNIVQANSSGQPSGSGLNAGGGTVLITESLIQNNLTEANAIAASGMDGVFTITHNQIVGNGGSAIGLSNTDSPYIAGNTIQGNAASGVYSIYGSAILVNNTIADNGSVGIYSQGDIRAIGNLIEGNTSRQYGGGVHILMAGGGSLFAHNIIRDNQSGGVWIWNGFGGGMYLDRCDDVPLTANLFVGNRSFNDEDNHNLGTGGGLYLHRSDVIMTNTMVVNNWAGGSGSGIYISSSSPTLLHTTIASNTDGNGTGIYASDTGWGPSVVDMKNTITVSQTTGVAVDSGSPQNLATLDGVLWWANGSNTSGTVFAFNEVAGEPAFVDPANGDYHIGPGSAAIDVGQDAAIATDVDGQSRPHYDGYDLGADEWWPLVVVKTVMPDTAEPGEIVTYTLTLTSATPAPLMVHLTDTLPIQVNYVGPMFYNNGSGGYAAGAVTWTGQVLTTTPTLITWAVEIASDVTGGSNITNTAIVMDAYGLFQTDPALIMVPQRNSTIYLPLVMRDYP